MSEWFKRSLLDNPRRLARLLLLLTVGVWGATFVLVKSALADVSPLLFNLLRMALAASVLVGLNWRRLRAITLTQMRAAGAAGIFLAAGYELQTLGLTRTTPARSAFITGLVVVFVPVLTLIPRFRPAKARPPGLAAAAGAVLAFFGLILLTTPAGTTLANLFAKIGAGDLLTLGCALAFAAHLLTLARGSGGAPAGVAATVQIAACALVMLLMLPLEAPRMSWTPRLLFSLAICSVFATAAAFTIQSFAQQHLPPTHTVLILTLEPVFAWIASLALLGRTDALDHRSLLGAGIILAGMLVVELLPGTHSQEIPA